MEKCLTEYAASLSGDDFEVFGEIISKKYFQFVYFFNLLAEYSEFITKMKYEISDEKTLNATVTFSKPIKKIVDRNDLILSWKEAGYDVNYTTSGKKMKLKITYNG